MSSETLPEGSVSPSAEDEPIIWQALHALAQPEEYEVTMKRGADRHRELHLRPVESTKTALSSPFGTYYNDPACLEPVEMD